MTEYLLASDEELARLQLQARVWEPAAEAMLDQIGLQPGWSCVDLGCGAMGILGPLARRVGAEGRVVGLDADDTLLSAARAYARQEALNHIKLVHADAAQSGLPQESFDFVHARFLFPHVAKPETLLEEMVGLAKPRGYVAAQEPDHSSWNFHPTCEAWAEFLGLLERTLALRGDINIGRRIFAMFRSAGLEDVTVRAGVVALQDGHPYMRMSIVGAQAMKSRMIAAGLATEERLNRLVAAVESCAGDPERMQITFTTVQVWGRKPVQAS